MSRDQDQPCLKLKHNLKARLDERGMTAAELARRSGIAKQVISDWLAGTKPKNIEHLKKVALILRTTVDELCFGASSLHDPCLSSLKGALIDGEWFSGIFEIKLRKFNPSHEEES